MSAFTAFSRVTLESCWCKRVCYDLQCFPSPPHTPPQPLPTSTPLIADLTQELAHNPQVQTSLPASDLSQTSTTIRAAATTHSPQALWSSCQMWGLSGSAPLGCKTLQKAPIAVPSHLPSGWFSCTSSHSTPWHKTGGNGPPWTPLSVIDLPLLYAAHPSLGN